MAKDIRVSRSKANLKVDQAFFKDGFAKYRAYADKQIGAFLKNKPDCNLFEKQHIHSGKIDGTTMILNSFGSSRDTFASA